MIIVKLGGSIITEKSRYKYFNKNNTINIVKQLKKLDKRLIIVHGGGSFGHIKSKEYNLPGHVNNKTLEGMSIVHNDMTELNLNISRIFNDNGMYNISIPPSSCIFGGNKNYDIFSKYASMNLIPITFGDVYMKDGENIGIYSGDNLVYDLSMMFKPEYTVFFSDVDGIYNKNPKKYKDAKLLNSINGNFQFESIVDDVTGGIMNKYNIMKKISSLGIKSYIINGLFPERIMDIGKNDFIGTVI